MNYKYFLSSQVKADISCAFRNNGSGFKLQTINNSPL